MGDWSLTIRQPNRVLVTAHPVLLGGADARTHLEQLPVEQLKELELKLDKEEADQSTEQTPLGELRELDNHGSNGFHPNRPRF
jgi:hypothetical protein